MLDLKPHLQQAPNMLECLPERIAKDPDQLRTRMEIMDLLPPILPAEALAKAGNRPEQVLDIGSAGGWGIEELGRRYPTATVRGLTLFAEEAKALAERGLEATVADMHEMPSAWAGRFDLVYASHVLEHSPAPLIALREVRRVLRPGGTAMIVMPDADGILHPFNAERFKRLGDLGGHIFCASVETTIYLIRKAGLTFRRYHEVAAMLQDTRCYWNRIWIARKP